MSKTLYSIIGFLVASSIFAQKKDETIPFALIPQEYALLHHEGEKSLLQKKYGEALKSFEKVLKKHPDFPPSLRGAGASLELMGDYEGASAYYTSILKKYPRFSRALYFECGNVFYKSGDYRLALHYFNLFDSLQTVDFNSFNYNGTAELAVDRSYKTKLPSSIRACQVAMDSIRFWNIPAVTNLGGNINSSGDEYFPFLTNDGQWIYYTSRKNRLSDEDLYLSKRNNRDWNSGEPVRDFNSGGNEGMTSLVRDGRRMFFTACQRPQVKGPCDIWEAGFEDGQFAIIQPVIGEVNSSGWESQACISCDGNTLFFSSNRQGGYGGADIWKSHKLPDGRWAAPINLGPNINTSGDEEAPFITNDGKVLYFSSTGHMGLGEQDIFMSRMDTNNEWGPPVNLGKPVNSSYREFGFFLTADEGTGYFSSDRKGGMGGMDIYKFELPEQLFAEPVTYVEGFVKDSISGLPVKTTVNLKGWPPVATDEQGRFFLCITAGSLLEAGINTANYHPYNRGFAIPQWNNETFFQLNILLDPLFHLPVYREVPVLVAPLVAVEPTTIQRKHELLFEFDQAELVTEMKIGLHRFINEVSEDKTIVHVEVIGYSDEVGTDSYNQVLSEKRARAVGVYLKEIGLQVDKVYIEGKGEARTGKPNWQNRKVEIILQLIQ